MNKNGSTSLPSVLNDPKRIETLERTGLLDSPPELAFDRLTQLASEMLDVPVALVSLVDCDRQFFKSSVGLSEPYASSRETQLSHSFCQHVVATDEPLVVNDAREHPLLHHNLAIRDLNVIAYLGVPLSTTEGETIGSFCAIDGKPRDWNRHEIKVMKELAGSVMTEVELRLLVQHFQKNCLSLRKLELEREEMVQMLVHDLRNPLSSLVLGLSALEITDIPTRSQVTLGAARNGAMLLSRMINDILDVGKAQAGHLGLRLSDVSAEDLAREACMIVNNLIMQNELGVEIMAEANLPLFRADQEKLRRTLVNLISNAVQHTPRKGKIKIAIRRDQATKHFIIEIADTGAGIPRDAFQQIFQKFQADRLPKGTKASTGLGLPFCKLAVEAHGGSITVESELGRGTTFIVEIPDHPPERR